MSALPRDRRAVPLERPGGAGAHLPGRYNICPTDTTDAVVEQGDRRDLVPMRGVDMPLPSAEDGVVL